MRIYPIPELSASRFSFRRSAMFCRLVAWVTSTLLTGHILGQQAINYSFFSKDALGGIRVTLPSPSQIEPVNTPSLSTNTQGLQPNINTSSGMGQQITGLRPDPNVGLTSNNAQAIQQQADLERESWLNELNKRALEKENKLRPYRE